VDSSIKTGRLDIYYIKEEVQKYLPHSPTVHKAGFVFTSSKNIGGR
jgi:hypothetical protein